MNSFSTYDYVREMGRFYFLKMGLFLAYFGVRFRQAFGFNVDADELQDFELDNKVF